MRTRRDHPRWGARRIALELGRSGCPGPVPSRMTVYRILARHGLHRVTRRRRGREDYIRWERAVPMELWQMDIVGGVFLADGSEVKVVTGVDDRSRFVVIASVVRRATGRAVCAAFVARSPGRPDEALRLFVTHIASNLEYLANYVVFADGGGSCIRARSTISSRTSPTSMVRWGDSATLLAANVILGVLGAASAELLGRQYGRRDL